MTYKEKMQKLKDKIIIDFELNKKEIIKLKKLNTEEEIIKYLEEIY